MKKTSLKQFSNLRTSGLIAIRLKGDDSLVTVQETTGDDHIIMITKNAKGIRFPEANVRPMGRATSGMKGINLDKGDEVISMSVFPAKTQKPKDKRKKFFRRILTISARGIGKTTPVRLFPIQKRAGKGVKAAVVNSKTGQLAAAALITHFVEQVVITSTSGQIIKLPLRNIPVMGRSTQGVIMMRFSKKTDLVAAMTPLEKIEKIEEVEAPKGE